MPDSSTDSAGICIEDIDSMARATYMWVRQQTFEQRFIGLTISGAEESNLAAGFLAGLRVRLTLGDTESVLLAYVYALMSGERVGATELAHELLHKSGGAMASCSGYLHGLKAARELLNGSDGLDFATRVSRPAARAEVKEH